MTIKLIRDDCLRRMKSIPKKSVDMILADLPYGVTNAKWDSVLPLDKLWKQYRRIIKDHGAIVLFGSEPFSSNVRMSNPRMYRYDWIWKKTMPTLFLQAHKMPLRVWENMMVFYKKLPTYNPQMRAGKPYQDRYHSEHGNDAFVRSGLKGSHKDPKHTTQNHGSRFPVNMVTFSNPNRKRYHPTQKPLDLLRYLIKTYTNENNLVLDNVMGSGSTGVACKQLNRNFIGIEKDVRYYNLANLRISKTKENKII